MAQSRLVKKARAAMRANRPRFRGVNYPHEAYRATVLVLSTTLPVHSGLQQARSPLSPAEELPALLFFDRELFSMSVEVLFLPD